MRSRKKTRQPAQSTSRVGGTADEIASNAEAAASAPVASGHDEAVTHEAVVHEVAAHEVAAHEVAAPVAAPAVLPEPVAAVETDSVKRFLQLRQRVLEEPSDVAARIELGQRHDARGEALLALEQYEAAAAAAPEDSNAALHYAQALTALNRFDIAEREVRRALRSDADNGALHMQLGIISYRRGLYTQAELELKRAIELAPNQAAAYFHRGESLNQLSRIDEALDMLERGIVLDPNHARAYYMMGILYDRKSRPQEAAAMYRRAREVASA